MTRHSRSIPFLALFLAMSLASCGGGGGDAGAASSPGTQTFSFTYAPAPPDNPLKGFMPYDGGSKDLPHSLEFFYLPLKDLQTGYGTFTWGSLDAHLAAIAGRGHQAVFRVYLDYPNKPYGVPDFLSAVPRHEYDDEGLNGSRRTGFSPDYANPDLQRALKAFIAALGKRYDGDSRVAFITAGLLGFWGEWHTYPHTEWMASPAFMNEVLDAYQAAFPHTLVLAREPKTGVTMDRPRLGFHDDSFAYQTLGPTSWHFWPRIMTAGLHECWKTRPIGGEVRPEVQSCMWNDAPCTPAGQAFNACVDATHASWMLNHDAFLGLTAPQRARALASARRMGYELHISSATLRHTRVGMDLQGELSLDNRGVAPFYYPWSVQLAALDQTGHLSAWSLPQDLRTLLPDAPARWTFVLPDHGLPAGTYTLLLGVPNPMKGGKPLRFANQTQDQDVDGWLTLGTLQVEP